MPQCCSLQTANVFLQFLFIFTRLHIFQWVKVFPETYRLCLFHSWVITKCVFCTLYLLSFSAQCCFFDDRPGIWSVTGTATTVRIDMILGTSVTWDNSRKMGRLTKNQPIDCRCVCLCLCVLIVFHIWIQLWADWANASLIDPMTNRAGRDYAKQSASDMGASFHLNP